MRYSPFELNTLIQRARDEFIRDFQPSPHSRDTLSLFSGYFIGFLLRQESPAPPTHPQNPGDLGLGGKPPPPPVSPP